MQKVTREILLAKAAELLNAGTVNRVLGWKAGEFTYDVTPAVFTSAAEGAKFAATMNEFVETVTKLGENKRLEDLRCKN